MVALVLTFLNPDPAAPARPSAVWERSLDSLLSAGRPTRYGSTPLAIELALAGGPGQFRAGNMPLRLTARLVRPAKNGGWAGGELTWGRLDMPRYCGDYREEQVRLLRELYGLYQARPGRGCSRPPP